MSSPWPSEPVEASTPGTGGFFETGHQRIGVQHVLPITTPEDLGQVPIEGPAGKLLLKDVATVATDHQPLIGDALLGKDAELLLVIEKFPETNTMDVTRGVDEALRSLQPGLPGVTIDTSVYRQASFIQEEVGTLGIAEFEIWLVRDKLASGQLEVVLPRYRLQNKLTGEFIYMAYLANRRSSAKLRVLRDFLAEHLAHIGELSEAELRKIRGGRR